MSDEPFWTGYDAILPRLLSLGASYLLILACVWKCFEKAESLASTRSRASLAAWLKGARPEDHLQSWAETLSLSFDSVFGLRHFTQRCFFACVAVTGVCVVVLFFISSGLWGFQIRDVPPNVVVIVYLSILSSVINFISFIETRFVLSLVKRASASLSIAILLVVDLLASACLGAIIPGTYVVEVYLSHKRTIELAARTGSEVLRGYADFTSGLSREVLLDVLLLRDYQGILFYSSFATSAWIWLYLSGRAVSVLAQRAGAWKEGLIWAVDIDSRPFQCIALLIVCVITLVYVVVLASIGLRIVW